MIAVKVLSLIYQFLMYFRSSVELVSISFHPHILLILRFVHSGRPQYESQGVGYICTTSDKLDHYISAITQQHPIESK